jgi:hypothetical protein
MITKLKVQIEEDKIIEESTQKINKVEENQRSKHHWKQRKKQELKKKNFKEQTHPRLLNKDLQLNQTVLKKPTRMNFGIRPWMKNWIK